MKSKTKCPEKQNEEKRKARDDMKCPLETRSFHVRIKSPHNPR
jgi:hypothetical protein